jgi:hypothetical protein
METIRALLFSAIGLCSGTCYAATISTPPTLILPNFDRTLVGQLQGFEAGAYVARAGDSSANWYNPAGLSRAERTSINASSSAIGWTSVTADAEGQSVGETTSSQVPQFFGIVIAAPIFHTDKIRAGFSLTQETAWTPALQEQLTVPQASGGSQRFGYSIRDNFGVSMPAFSVGYHPAGPWRWGATLSLVSTDYLGNETVSQQQLSSPSQSNVIRASQIGASSMGALVGLGAQYDLSKNWHLGMLIKSPSLSLWGSSQVNYESLTSSGGQTTDVNFYDSSADFKYRLPLNANFGAAYTADRFEVEADIRYHASLGTYAVLNSGQPIATSVNSGGAPTTTSEHFDAFQVAFRNILDFAVGGNYSLSPTVGLHGGFYSSYSPVREASNPVFRKIDLYGATFGSSLKISNVAGSLGAAYEWGSSDPFTVTNDLTGKPFDTIIHVSTLKLLFALSIGF